MTPRIPRDVSGLDLVTALSKYGYEQTRQTGSHVRLTTHRNGTHHITVPLHRPLKLGTLSGILGEVARHLEVSKTEIIQTLF
ncbi:MAG: hypothetical protein DRJ61_06240 [Acidobacteria bacterium]|nr:MAG: hypothetical protein DRJ65_09945 [Acidobacteriota bacterium]RLE33920.1 MAG: hypothetical protein DRJ61_06240 [Acidobacteriota bacterium]